MASSTFLRQLIILFYFDDSCVEKQRIYYKIFQFPSQKIFLSILKEKLFVENHGIFENNPNSVEVAKILLQYVFRI